MVATVNQNSSKFSNNPINHDSEDSSLVAVGEHGDTLVAEGGKWQSTHVASVVPDLGKHSHFNAESDCR